MVEKKLYKTRLCLLYQRGRCSRQYCNFAHGSAELRGSFNGRQEEYHGRDLRESLGRNRSPLRKFSPRRDDRARHSSRGNSPRSPMKRIDRNHRKRQRLDGNHDYSGSMRMSDGNEDQNRERTWAPSDSKVHLDGQLRHVLTELKILDSDKQKLEIFLEEKVQEADALTLKIHDLEIQLSKEKEEAKRSNAQILKLGDQLDFNAARQGSNEEDSKINTVSDDETGVNNASPLNGFRINSSPNQKKSREYPEAHDASNQVNIVKGDRTEIRGTRREKPSRQTEHREQLIWSKESDANNRCDPLAYEDKLKKGTYQPRDVASADKAPEMGPMLPSTGLAAHALDEYIEDHEMDEKFRVTGAASTRTEPDANMKVTVLPFPPPPPPPLPQNVYSQYEGDDEHVEIDEVDEETVEVDII
ncbi:zinc finger CCCH domain-containing protein 13 [Dorcoceras hygrometricum]|uniref:Zinc finger CCCH domain-containing protein 13 n=1 Tax=Dorcoceras hygrometricum TaxID=472368 RepID=A0A2Z7C7N1_9LAMI|nr:zinc finger CCCH domain-containing protein 13 [Dorcoceras hygrometricum]